MKRFGACLILSVCLLIGKPLLASPLAATGTDTGKKLTAEDFALLPQIQSPAISPDGLHIAARIAVRGEQYLVVISTKGEKPKVIHLTKVDINWWQWVNNNWLIVGLGANQKFQGEDIYVTRAGAIKADGSESRLLATKGQLGQNASDIVWRATDGTARVMLGIQRSVYASDLKFWPTVIEIELNTNKQHLATGSHEGVMDWVADRSGTVRLGYGRSTDGLTGRILYRPDNQHGFKTIDRMGRGEDAMDTPDYFLPNGQAISIAADKQGQNAIFSYDLDKMGKSKLLYSTPGYDIGGIVTDPGTGDLIGYRALESRPHIKWIQPDLVAFQKQVDQQVKGADAQIVSVDAAHQNAVVLISAADAPGAYFLYRRSDGEMAPLGQVNTSIGMHKLNPVQVVHYKARDGVDIEAILTLPKGKSSNLPLIVLPHGGPFARDYAEWDFWVQFLAAQGYAVVQPNYRGSSGYGGHFAKLGEGQWGLKMQDDLVDAIAFLKKRGIADDKRVCIAGASYGGYAAIRAAERDASHYRCAISYAGVSDLNAMIRYNQNFLYADAKSDWLNKQAPDLKAVSPIQTPEDIKLPLLLVHGKEDRVVPYRQSRDMARKLEKLNKPVTYIEQPLADHHFTRMEDRLEFLKAMKAFLDKYNPA